MTSRMALTACVVSSGSSSVFCGSFAIHELSPLGKSFFTIGRRLHLFLGGRFRRGFRLFSIAESDRSYFSEGLEHLNRLQLFDFGFRLNSELEVSKGVFPNEIFQFTRYNIEGPTSGLLEG